MKFIYYLANFSYYVFFIFSSGTKVGFIGKGKLFITYSKFYLKYLFLEVFFKRKILKERLFGFEIRLLEYSDFICMFEEIFIRKVYYFRSRLKNPLVFDCGAHLGLASIFFKMLYPDSKIIAFEPDAKSFFLLKENIGINKITNVSLVNKALSDKGGTVNFYFNPKSLNSLSKSIVKERTSDSVAFKKLPAVKLSTFIRKEIDFLKMDIEGAESLVIGEISKAQKLGLVREAVIEIHHHLEAKKDDISQILRIFEKNGFGYQIQSIPRTPFVKESFQDILLYVYRK